MTLDQKLKRLDSYLATNAKESAVLAFDDAAELYAAGDFDMASRRLEQAASRVWGDARPDGWHAADSDPFADYADLPSNDGHANERRRASILDL